MKEQLEACLLTEKELAEGEEAWPLMHDPFAAAAQTASAN